MDGNRFEPLLRSLSTSPSRRSSLRLLAGLVLGGPLALRSDPAAAHDALRTCKKLEDKGKKQKCQKKARKHQARHRQQTVPPPPPPVPVLTYECPEPPDLVTAFETTERLAHRFTAAQSGLLLQIQFEISKRVDSTGDFVVELLVVGADGVPTNTELAEVTIPNASVPDGFSTLTGSFSGPPLVVGTEYAAALSRPGGSHLTVRGRGGNPCTGRTFRQNPIGTGAFSGFGIPDFVTSVTVLA